MEHIDIGWLANSGGEHKGWSAMLLSCAAILLAGGCAAWQLSSWPVRFRYPGEWCGVEGMRLGEMQHLGEGIPIYAPASAERFDAAIHGAA
jgi:hypothetical protein